MPKRLRSANECEDAVRRLGEAKRRLEQQRRNPADRVLTAAEVKRALDPARSFHAQLAEEIEDYERRVRPPGRRR